MKKIHKYIFEKQAIAALIIVIVIASVSLITALSLATIGISEVSNSYDQTESANVRTSVDGCVEESLRLLAENSSYTGSSFSLFDTSCIVSVVDNSGNKTVTVSGTKDTYTRISEVVVDSSSLEISSWIQKTN